MVVSFFIFIIALLIAVPMRLWQFLAHIDITTGFFRLDVDWIYIFAGILVVAVIFIFLFTLTDKNTMDFPYRNGTKVAGIAFLVLTGVFFYQFFQDVKINYLPMLSSGIALSGGQIVLVLMKIVLIVAVFLISIMFILGKTQNNTIKLALIVPIIWSIIRLWQIYMFDNPNITVSENLMEICSYFCLAWFLTAFAYCIAGFGTVSHTKQVVVVGFTGSLFMLSNSLGKLFAILKFGFEFGTLDMNRIAVNLAIGLIMLICPIYICFGADPLLDYDALYEADSNVDDPIDPKANLAPITPAKGMSSKEIIDNMPSLNFEDSNLEILDEESAQDELDAEFPSNPNFVSMTYSDFVNEEELAVETRRKLAQETTVLDAETLAKHMQEYGDGSKDEQDPPEDER